MSINTYTHNYVLEILGYIFMIFTILQSNSVYLYNDDTVSKFIVPIWQVILISLFLIALFEIRSINSRLFIFILFFICIVTLFLVIEYFNYEFGIGNVLLLLIDPVLIIIYIYHLYQQGNINSLFYKFEDIMILLSVISVIFWILGSLNVPTNMSTLLNFGTSRNYITVGKFIPGYFDLHFFAQGHINFLGIYLLRNTGIFAEAPMYSSMLNIALFVELFLRNASRIFNLRTIMLSIAILTTTSTNGIILLLLSLSYVGILRSENIKKRINLLAKIIASIIIFIITILLLRFIIINKINSSDVYSSSSIRFNDFIVTFNAWKQHIFIGNGLNNNMSILQNMPSWRILNGNGNLGISTGFMRILAFGGIFLEMYYVLPIILNIGKSKNIIGFSLFIFILFIIEGIDTYYIVNIIICYLWIVYLFCDKKESNNIEME